MKTFRNVPLFFLLVGLAVHPPPSSAQQGPSSPPLPYKSVREALRAIKASKDENQQRRIYQSFHQIPIADSDDLLSLHAEARDRENNIPLLAANDTLMKYGGDAELITRHIADANAPQFEEAVARLLQDELDSAMKVGRPARSVPTTRGAIKIALREIRIKSLMNDAGEGKYTKARDVLWRYIELERDGGFGQEAVATLGRIGNMADFERLLAMVEKNPSLRFPLGEFGSAALPRLIQEIGREDVGRDVKGNLAGALSRAATHEAIPSLMPLRQSKDPFVSETALRTIAKILSREDVPLATQLLDSPSSTERAIVLTAVGEHAWNEKYIPALIMTLKKDADYSNRGLAAFYLGQHKVKEALPDLKVALNDPVPNVRQNVEAAIGRIDSTSR